MSTIAAGISEGGPPVGEAARLHRFRAVWPTVPVACWETSRRVRRVVENGLVAIQKVWFRRRTREWHPVQWCGEMKQYYANPQLSGRCLSLERKKYDHHYVLHYHLGD